MEVNISSLFASHVSLSNNDLGIVDKENDGFDQEKLCSIIVSHTDKIGVFVA